MNVIDQLIIIQVQTLTKLHLTKALDQATLLAGSHVDTDQSSLRCTDKIKASYMFCKTSCLIKLPWSCILILLLNII